MPLPPLAELYDLLRAEGFAIGVDDHVRLGRLLAHDVTWTLESLRLSVAALVMTDPNDRRSFDACWERWLRSRAPDAVISDRAADMSAKTSAPVRRKRVRAGAIVVTLAIVLAGGLVVKRPAKQGSSSEQLLGSGHGSADAIDRMPSKGSSATSPENALPSNGSGLEHSSNHAAGSGGPGRSSSGKSAGTGEPDVHVTNLAGSGHLASQEASGSGGSDHGVSGPTQEPPSLNDQASLSHAVIGVVPISVMIGAIVLAIIVVTVAYRARTQRRFVSGPWRYVPAVPIAVKPVLPRREIEDAAADLTWQASGGVHEIDIERSVTATVECGGLPTLVHRGAKAAPRYLVLEDSTTRASGWRFIYDELLRGLVREGVELQRYTFAATPEYCVQPDGNVVPLDQLVDDGDALIVIGDGDAAVDPLDGKRAEWLGLLHCIPRRLWINPLPPMRWSAGAHAIAQETRMEHGAARVFPALSSGVERITRPPRPYPAVIEHAPDTESAVVALRAALGEPAFQLVAALAVTAPPTIAAARWLAELLALELGEQDWLAITTLPWFRTEEWPGQLREGLQQALADDDPDLAQTVAAISDELLAGSEPPRNSAAHLEWQLETASRAVHRGERAAAIHTLSKLDSTPLVDQVRDLSAALRRPGRDRNPNSLSHRLVLGIGLASAMAMSLVGLIVWDLYYRTHVAYYRDYNRRWGEPEGVYELSDGELHARTASFRLVREGHLGHVVHVELVRSDGELARFKPVGVGDDPEVELRQKVGGERTPCQWDFAFEPDTKMVSTETARDRSGAVVYVLRYDGPRDRRKAQFLNEKNDLAPVVRGEATRVEFWRSAQGYDIAKHYIKASGEPGRNQDGIFVEKLDYDARGNLIARRFFDDADRPMLDNTGAGGYRAVFDPHGNQTEITLIDETGQPVRGKDGHAGWRSEFDEHGNETRRTYVDETGKSTPVNDGYVGYRSTYDAAGNRTELVYLDDAGRPTRDENGVATFRSTFDTHGNEIGRTFFDETGKPTWSRDGYAGYRLAVGTAGNLTAVAFLDDAGKPTRGKEGHAGWRSEFDDHGNELRRTYVDETGAPTRDKFGVASYRSTFDPRGNETGRAFFDDAGKPTRSNEGYASYQATFDDWGNRTEIVYLDEAGKPTPSNEGYACLRAMFDAHNNRTEVVYLDEAGKPTRDKFGIASYRSTFDPRGNETARAYFDEAGKPARNNEGYASYTATFDAPGNRTEVAYFNETGKPTRNKQGYASYRAKFDPRGNLIEAHYFDDTGKPTRNKQGYAGLHAKFDPRGNQTEVTQVGENDKPVRDRDNTAGSRSTYDAQGNATLVMFVDEAGKPARVKDGFAGYRSAFDSRGNETEHVYLDEAGNPMRLPDGYAGHRSRFDPRGYQIEHTFIDEAGAKIRGDGGYATYRATVDVRGNVTEAAYLDEADRPVQDRYGVAKYSSMYDPYGNETERNYFDVSNRPIRNKDGYAGYRTTYDPQGNATLIMFLDETHKPVRTSDGIAGFSMTYDALGNEIVRRYLDEAQRLTRSKAGYAGYRTTYDALGHKTGVEFFDDAGVVVLRTPVGRNAPSAAPHLPAPPRSRPTGTGLSGHSEFHSGSGGGTGCQTMIELAEMCYQHSASGSSCDDMYTEVREAASSVNLSSQGRHALASLCETACQARQNGMSWDSVRGVIRQSCLLDP